MSRYGARANSVEVPVLVESKDRVRASLRIILGDFVDHFMDRGFGLVDNVCRLNILQSFS